ncbi:MAG: CHAT domain-containing protein [Candidatus Brocadiae bacterium]|nr:CHAT domain-containing protein [Candidatus Brocadiia bacterium]
MEIKKKILFSARNSQKRKEQKKFLFLQNAQYKKFFFVAGLFLVFCILFFALQEGNIENTGVEKEDEENFFEQELENLSTENALNLAKKIQEKGIQLYKTEEYDKSERFLKFNIFLYSKYLPADHIDLAVSLYTLANILEIKGDYANAESFSRRALEIREKHLGKDHIDVANSLDHLAGSWGSKGNYEECEILLRRALEIREKHLGKDHIDVATSLDHLSALLGAKGDRIAAETLCRKSLEIREKHLGKDHIDVATSLDHLAYLLEAKGDHIAAEVFCRKARKIWQKNGSNLDIAKNLYILGSLVLRKKDALGAEIYFNKALDLLENSSEKKQLRENQLLIADIFLRLGSIKFSYGENSYDYLFNRALEIKQKILPKDHPDIKTTLSWIDFYRNIDTNASVDLGLLMGKSIKKAHEAKNTDQKKYNLTKNIRNKKDKEAQNLNLLSSFTEMIHRMCLVFPSLTERQQESYLQAHIRFRLGIFLSGLLSPLDQKQVYSNLMLYRGISSRTLRDRVLATETPQIAQLYEQLSKARREYAAASILPNPTQEQKKIAQEALEQKEKAERELRQISRGFSQNQKNFASDIQGLQNTLGQEDVLVDFLFYNHTEPRRIVGLYNKERLIAFIIKPKGTVVRVDLGEALPVRQAAESFRQELISGKNILIDGETSGEALYRLVWKPLQKHLRDKTRAYIIPDDILCFIPFEALIRKNQNRSMFLAERIEILYLSSPLDLLEYSSESPQSNEGFLCLGGVSYSGKPKVSHQIASRSSSLDSPEKGESFWGDLPGAEWEAKNLAKIYKKTHPQNPLIYLSKQEACEENLIRKAPGIKYCHLATHGFFKSILQEEQNTRSKKNRDIDMLFNPEEESQLTLNFFKSKDGINPYLYSGIVLAGANLKQNSANFNDGILTAEELAAINLRGMSLLTLSACETGIGVGISGQGISGLRMAAQVAGVRSMLISLWKVDDVGTQAFMEAFYKRLWHHKKGKLQSLRETRLEWIKKNRLGMRGAKGEDIYSLRVWAAFILSGEK